jgi:integrase
MAGGKTMTRQPIASAYRRKDSRFWWITYRAPGGARKACSLPTVTSEDQALELAHEISAMTRLADERRNTAAMDYLIQSGIVTDAESRALWGYSPHSAPILPGQVEVTILSAALEHRATQREERTAGLSRDAAHSYERHKAGVQQFCEFIGSDSLSVLSEDNVLRFVNHLRDNLGLSYDSIRHATLWLKRAAARGTRYGVMDDLGHKRLLDRRDFKRADALQFYRTPELLAIGAFLLERGDTSRFLAVALQAFMGLRVSEAARLRVEDANLSDGVLSVGAREAKNTDSRRKLPMPGFIAKFVAERCAGADGSAALCPSESRGVECSGDYHRFGRWAQLHFEKATGRELPTKCLRKSFATEGVSTWKLEPPFVEAFLGHKFSGVSGVTQRSYLDDWSAEELRPTARKIDQFVADRATF